MQIAQEIRQNIENAINDYIKSVGGEGKVNKDRKITIDAIKNILNTESEVIEMRVKILNYVKAMNGFIRSKIWIIDFSDLRARIEKIFAQPEYSEKELENKQRKEIVKFMLRQDDFMTNGAGKKIIELETQLKGRLDQIELLQKTNSYLQALNDNHAREMKTITMERDKFKNENKELLEKLKKYERLENNNEGKEPSSQDKLTFDQRLQNLQTQLDQQEQSYDIRFNQNNNLNAILQTTISDKKVLERKCEHLQKELEEMKVELEKIKEESGYYKGSSNSK